MTIQKERSAREGLKLLASLREQAPDKEAFDQAIAALQQVLEEYNGFDTSLVLIHRLTNHALDEDARLRDEGGAVGLRLGKTLSALWDANYASRQENAERGPLHPHIATMES